MASKKIVELSPYSVTANKSWSSASIEFLDDNGRRYRVPVSHPGIVSLFRKKLNEIETNWRDSVNSL